MINRQKTGYLQLLKPIEDLIFSKANLLLSRLDEGKGTEDDILSFYSWIDQYLAKSYQERFNLDLFGK